MYSKNTSDKQYVLNMPQLHVGGLYENWLLKELGDVHWLMMSNCLNVNSDEVRDSHGERLYASFVRLRWDSSDCLRTFKENEKVSLHSELSFYGDKMFFSNAVVTGEEKVINASLFSVFSARMDGDNNQLEKRGVSLDKVSKSGACLTLPAFAKEYLEFKAALFSQAGTAGSRKLTLNGEEFSFSDNVIYEKEYVVDVYDDMNGVGLLYFASYPKINDKCERSYFRDRIPGHLPDWVLSGSSIARDVLYFGNANIDEVLIYKLNSFSFTDENDLKISSSLYRKADGQLIARIFTVKHVLPEVADVLLKRADEGLSHYKELSVEDTPRFMKNSTYGKAVPGSDRQPVGLQIEKSEGESIQHDRLNKIIISFISQIIEVDGIKEHTDLTGLGVESIIIMELSEYLNREYDFRSKPDKLYGYKTISEITGYLLKDAIL
ncbi:hypothetical protein ECE50_002390 [Chitinophaga sp. Mgbs1]|uniref:Carrier domain-containing protein n=1 Tax=Chitinophaga solisilvae TaxID=1233460 RepID=A0A9Q5D8G3_9BACT|nr:hypothetical protein [Chitinophaga solisilvae]